MFKKIKSWFSNDWRETKLLFRNLPAVPFAILCIALVVMNVLANKLIVETINKVIIDVYAMLAETELQRKKKE